MTGEYLGSSTQVEADPGDDLVPLIFFPSSHNIIILSTDWVLTKVKKIQQCGGISCDGFEDQFVALPTTIEARHFHVICLGSKRYRKLKYLPG